MRRSRRSMAGFGGAAVAVLMALSVSPMNAAEPTTSPARTGSDEAAPIEGSTADWKQVSVGGVHACGIRDSGRLYCWGGDFNGQLGDGGSNTEQPEPAQVAGGGTQWASVDAGASHTCARKTTGRLFCWGSDIAGGLGNGGGSTDAPAPVQVSGAATNWTSVSAGNAFTCARKTNGRLYCWGRDNYGRLGNGGANTDRQVPVQVAGAFTNWASVSAGEAHACARKTTGRLYCWGEDLSGELGEGAGTADQPAPVQVAGALTTWTSVSAGQAETCARRSNGRLFCWGADDAGQLGDGGGNTNQPAPVEVSGAFTDWTSVTVGGGHACGRRGTGQLFCWGFDVYGALGDGGANTDQPAPVEVSGALTNWTAVSGGGYFTCARQTTHRLYCWGTDLVDQLGDGDGNTDQPAPVQVS